MEIIYLLLLCVLKLNSLFTYVDSLNSHRKSHRIYFYFIDEFTYNNWGEVTYLNNSHSS